MLQVVLVLAPFALFPRLGTLSIVLSGILGMFYRGLLELSKSFLDPFGNEGSIGQNLQIDCLMGEVNARSVSWVNASEELPEPMPKALAGVAAEGGGKVVPVAA